MSSDSNFYNMSMEDYKTLIQVPSGRVKADKVIINAHIVNVYTGTIQTGLLVAIKGKHIAYVGPSNQMVGEETEIIDAERLYLSPGFIDPHGHTDFGANPIALTNEILAHGTTAILTDTKSITAAMRAKGIEGMMEMTDQLPVKFFYSVCAANPVLPKIEGEESLTLEEFKTYLQKNRTVAVSELVSWIRAIDLDETLLTKLAYARSIAKRIEGHGAGCSLETLNALLNVGITSCHESISAENIQQRIDLGLHTMLRHGSILSDMEPLSAAITQNPGLDIRWLMMTPDWFSPKDILAKGYMKYLVKDSIKHGIPPVKAIQMATINAASYMRVDNIIGGIGPSRYADMLFLDSLASPDPVKVMVNGEIVAENGRILSKMPINVPQFTLKDWRPGRVPTFDITPEHFTVRSSVAEGEFEQVPVVKIVSRTITKLDHIQIQSKSGLLNCESQDILKISMVHIGAKKLVSAFMKGFGTTLGTLGALATSTAHDHHTPFVIGSNDSDMVLAFNRMLEIGGGLVLVERGAIKAECPMVIGGIMSNKDVAVLEKELSVIEEYLMSLGCPAGILVTLDFIAHTGVPFIRMTPSGLYDVRSKKILFASGNV